MNNESKLPALAAAGLFLAATACVGARQDPLAERLVGEWRLAKICQYDVPAGVTPCSPMASMVAWLTFETDGTATQTGPSGPSGRYRIERRELPSGATETLLSIDGRNMGQLSFVGDTLLLGMAYVDGPDRYFVRLPWVVPRRPAR